MKNYIAKIESYNEDDPQTCIFTVESFDEYAATLKMDTLVTADMLDDLFAAIRDAVNKLELKTNSY